MFQLGGIIEGFVHILEKYLRKLVYLDGIVLSNDFFEKERKEVARMIYWIIYLFIYNLDLDFLFHKYLGLKKTPEARTKTLLKPWMHLMCWVNERIITVQPLHWSAAIFEHILECSFSLIQSFVSTLTPNYLPLILQNVKNFFENTEKVTGNTEVLLCLWKWIKILVQQW